ncbi:MAG TPA: hypothetical protein VG651_15790 [Stellaceae bacterium]|nr:hypothetical protein [Stellaceae bacterium]
MSSYPRLLFLLSALLPAVAGAAQAAPQRLAAVLVAQSQAAQSQAAQSQAGPEAQGVVPPAPKPPANPGDEPTFKAPPSLARGDALDEWCKGMTAAINLAVCGDDQLRALALERLRAFNETNARLSPEQRKTLAADQNGWAMSYPQSCGLAAAEPPAIPLPASEKACLEQAGRKRLAYLRAYGRNGAPEPVPGTVPPAIQAAQAAVPLKPDTATPAEREPPAKTAAADTAAAPIQIPPAQQTRSAPAQQAQAQAQPQTQAQAQGQSQPPKAAAQPAYPADKPAADGLPGAVKIGALLIALAVICIWVVGGVRRLRGRGRTTAADHPAHR